MSTSQYARLQEIGKSCAEGIAVMVAALEVDYDRLHELDTPELNAAIANLVESDDATELVELREAAGDCDSLEDAEQRISEDPLSIELGGTWALGEKPTADRAFILLGTGGPAVRVVCELDDAMEPRRAWIEAQDWGTTWTQYFGDAVSQADLLAYCGRFYFGEG